MGDTSIELRLNIHRFNALEEALNEEGSSLEEHMQNYLIDLYVEMVSNTKQQEIDQLIAEEDLRIKQQQADMRRFSVFRITEKGSTVCLECNHAFEFMQAANQVRRYQRQEMDPQPGAFAEYFLTNGTLINEETFGVLVGERIEGSYNITGLCDIDLDSGMFHTARHPEGWTSFRLKDVNTAAYYAYRKGYRSYDDMWKIFLDYLDGRQITEASAAMSMEM